MGDERYDGLLVEEPHGCGSQACDVHQRVAVGVFVHQRVAHVERAARRVDDVHGAEVLVLRPYADDLFHHLHRVRVLRVQSGDEGVGLARLHHHHAEVVALEHLVVGLLKGVSLALPFAGQYAGVALAALLLRWVAQVDYLYAVEAELQLLCQLRDDLVVAQQDGVADAFGLCLYGCLQHGGVYGLGEDHALRVGCCGGVELLRELGLLSEQHRQRVFVGFPVVDGLACHAALYGCACHGGAHLADESWVDGLRYEVVAAEVQVVHLVHVVHHVGHWLLGQVGNGVYGGHLHLFVDGGGVHVECAAEDVGESDDVVYLVGIVGASCRHQHVGACVHGVLVGDLRRGVGQGEDDGVVGHRAHHVLRQHVALRQSYEHVGAAHGLFQRVYVAAVGGEEALLVVQSLAVAGDDALRVEHHDVLLLCAQRHVELGARDGCRAGAVHHDAHLLDVLAAHLEGVLQSGGADDGRAVLVVVHHGYVERALQPLFYVEALRSLDVLQVDASEGGCYALHGFAELLGVFLGHLDVEHVDAAVDLEQQSLALHDGLAAHGTYVAQSQHGGAVGDDGHEVAFVGVAVGVVGVFLNLEAGVGHAWRVGQRQVSLCAVSLCRLHFNLARASALVIGQGSLF